MVLGQVWLRKYAVNPKKEKKGREESITYSKNEECELRKSSHRHCCHIHMLIVPYWALVPCFSLVPEFRNSWAPWRKEVICLPYLHSPSFLNKWNFGVVSRPKKLHFPASLAERRGQWNVKGNVWVELPGIHYYSRFFLKGPCGPSNKNLWREKSKGCLPPDFYDMWKNWLSSV